MPTSGDQRRRLAGAETSWLDRADGVDFIQMSKSRGAVNGWPATSGGDDKCPFMGLGSILKFRQAPRPAWTGRGFAREKAPYIHYTGWEKAVWVVCVLFS